MLGGCLAGCVCGLLLMVCFDVCFALFVICCLGVWLDGLFGRLLFGWVVGWLIGFWLLFVFVNCYLLEVVLLWWSLLVWRFFRVVCVV